MKEKKSIRTKPQDISLSLLTPAYPKIAPQKPNKSHLRPF